MGHFVRTWSHFDVTAITLVSLGDYFGTFWDDFDATWRCLEVTLASLWANEDDLGARWVAMSSVWQSLGATFVLFGNHFWDMMVPLGYTGMTSEALCDHLGCIFGM